MAQHDEYMSVRAEPAEEVASRHGKARRRYTSAGRGSKAEHFAPKTPPPAASAPREPKASASDASGSRPKASASRSPPLPKASTACAIVPQYPNELTPPLPIVTAASCTGSAPATAAQRAADVRIEQSQLRIRRRFAHTQSETAA